LITSDIFLIDEVDQDIWASCDLIGVSFFNEHRNIGLRLKVRIFGLFTVFVPYEAIYCGLLTVTLILTRAAFTAMVCVHSEKREEQSFLYCKLAS